MNRPHHAAQRSLTALTILACMLAISLPLLGVPGGNALSLTVSHAGAQRAAAAQLTATAPGGVAAPNTAVQASATPTPSTASTQTATAPITPTCSPPWQIVSLPLAGQSSTLAAVAALSAGDVWAVGASVAGSGRREQTLTLHFDGTAWRIIPSAPIGTDSRLFGVAAVASNDVWAVGDYIRTTLTEPLILHGDGHGWQIVPAPLLRRRDGATLRGLAAVSGRNLWAVGGYSHGGQTLILHYDGTHWREVATPGLSGALSAIAGASARDLWAVGAVTGPDLRPLILHYDGRRWQQAHLPALAGPATLSAISVRGARDVWAGGGYEDATAAGWALTLHFDGRRWTEAPNVPGADVRALGAAAANNVWGLGANGASEHWDGTRWQLLLNPIGGGAATTAGAARRGPQARAIAAPLVDTLTQTATGALTGTSTQTPTDSPTGTATSTPTDTATPTTIPTDTDTPTPAGPPTDTPTGTLTPTPPPAFTQCPPIGGDAGCGILITLNADGTTTIVNDQNQPPYDGSDDTLVGVHNGSSVTVPSISLNSTRPIFGLDGDGLCTASGAPSGCPFGQSGYEGPGTSFSSSDTGSGTVYFTGGLAPGANAYFSLEDVIDSPSIAVVSPSPTDTPTASDTPTSAPTDTPTNTPTDTATATNTPMSVPTSTPTNTPTNTPTAATAGIGGPVVSYPNAVLAMAVISPHNIWAVGSHDQGQVTRDGAQIALVEHFTSATLCAGALPRVRTIPVETFPQALAMDPQSGHAFVLNSDRTLSMIDTRTGTVRRTVALASTTGGALTSDPGIARLFVTDAEAGGEGSISTLDSRTGRVLRQLHSGVHPFAATISARTGHAFVVSAQDHIGTVRGRVTMLDALSGAVLRTTQVGRYPSAIVADDQLRRVYVLNSGDGSVSTLDATTGHLLRTVAVGDLTASGPSIVAVDERTGRLFIGDAQDHGTNPSVSVLDAGSGAVRRTVNLSQHGCSLNELPRALAVDARTRRVFVACGSVILLDASSGAVKGTVAVGAVPDAIAVDEGTGRVFVAHLDDVNSSGAASGPGAVSVLDAHSGQVQAVVPVGWGPTALSVNAATRQVVVLNQSTAGGVSAGTVSLFSENALPPATLTAQPRSAKAGGVVTLAGAGYAPGEAITLLWAAAPRATKRAHADATGALARARLRVPAGLKPGRYAVAAVGTTSGRFAQTTVLIQPSKPRPKPHATTAAGK